MSGAIRQRLFQKILARKGTGGGAARLRGGQLMEAMMRAHLLDSGELRGGAIGTAPALADECEFLTKAIKKEAASMDPADVRGLTMQTLPALRKHLATAQSIG